MLPLTLPSPETLSRLTSARDDASVTLYCSTSPLTHEVETNRTVMKNAIRQASAELADGIAPADRQAAVIARLERLHEQRNFWQNQAHGLAIFVNPDEIHTFRLAHAVPELVAVGDRYDTGPLIRSLAADRVGYVLTITRAEVHLYAVDEGRSPEEIPLDSLPDDLARVLEYADNEGQMDRARPQGTLGQSVEYQRYCRLVQDAVQAHVTEHPKPLILAASDDLDPAYRVINTYDGLLDESITAHPDALDARAIAEAASGILRRHYDGLHETWLEHFGTLSASGRASTDLAEVARAASSGAVAELVFDPSDGVEGVLSESGEITFASEPGPSTYRVVDEVVARVLRAGGAVRAVTAENLPAPTPVAAVLRFPLSA